MGMAEGKILSQRDPKPTVMLAVKRGLGSSLAEVLVLFVGGRIGRALFETPFVKALQQEGAVEAGDMKDVTGKFLKLEELALTDKSIVMFYKKGTISKKDKAIALPLQYAESAEVQSGRIGGKSLGINFSVPGEKKPIEFVLAVTRIKEPERWLREINRIISAPTSPRTRQAPV